MSVADITIKELFGSKLSRYVYVILAVILLMWNLPRFVVTVPVFAGAIQEMQQQMWTGDRLQEKQWLEGEVRRLRDERARILRVRGDNLSTLDKNEVDEMTNQMDCYQKRIDQINYDMENKWRGQ